jgi:chromosome segregation ATPase
MGTAAEEAGLVEREDEMTKTPRTDNAAGDGTTVPADFAADLERELNEARAEVERLRASLEKTTSDLVAHRAEANALEDVVRQISAECESLRAQVEAWTAIAHKHAFILTCIRAVLKEKT